EHAYGMTANAFSSVSLDPPLILVCVISPSEGADHISRNQCFAVNVLSAEQEPLSRYFASRERPKGRDAFREVSHRIGTSGSPSVTVASCAAKSTCRLSDRAGGALAGGAGVGADAGVWAEGGSGGRGPRCGRPDEPTETAGVSWLADTAAAGDRGAAVGCG